MDEKEKQAEDEIRTLLADESRLDFISSSSKDDITDTSNNSIVDEIQTQRKAQRKVIFKFSLWMAGISMSIIFLAIIIQSIVRLCCNETFSILENYQLEIIGTGVLGFVFGIVAIITKSIWNDENYKDILRDDHNKKHNKDKKEK